MENKYASDSLLIWLFVIAISITMAFKFNRFDKDIRNLDNEVSHCRCEFERFWAYRPRVIGYVPTNSVPTISEMCFCTNCGVRNVENIPMKTMLEMLQSMLEDLKRQGVE